MMFYNVFVAFVRLNNITILAMQNIEFGSVSSDRYPDPAEKASIEAIPILNIELAHPYPLCPASLKHFVFYKVPASDKHSLL